MNNCIFSGRLSNDPVINKNQQGESNVARFSLAVDGRAADENGNRKPVFLSMVAFSKYVISFIEKNLHKGDKILVTCGISNSNFVNKEGKNVYQVDYYVDSIEFGESKADKERRYAQAAAQAQNVPAPAPAPAPASAPAAPNYNNPNGNYQNNYQGGYNPNGNYQNNNQQNAYQGNYQQNAYQAPAYNAPAPATAPVSAPAPAQMPPSTPVTTPQYNNQNAYSAPPAYQAAANGTMNGSMPMGVGNPTDPIVPVPGSAFLTMPTDGYSDDMELPFN